MAFRITVDTGEWARIAAAMSGFNTGMFARCMCRPSSLYRQADFHVSLSFQVARP
jgi:hypothetical protein